MTVKGVESGLQVFVLFVLVRPFVLWYIEYKDIERTNM